MIDRETQEALRLTPNSVIAYDNVVGIYLALNRFDEAPFDKSLELKLDDRKTEVEPAPRRQREAF